MMISISRAAVGLGMCGCCGGGGGAKAGVGRRFGT